MKITGRAERKLLDAIYDALFEELGKGNGLVSDKGNPIKLSTAIEEVFRNFNRNENVKIIRGVVSDLKEITDLNKKYFSLFKVRAQRLSKIVAQVEAEMTERLGIDENGRIVRGGYLDNLIEDTSLKNKIQSEIRKASANGLDVKETLNSVKQIVVGDADNLGGLSNHYRTYVHDTFAQYDNGIANGIAVKLELNAAIYSGGLIETSRELCKKYNGKVLTRKEIEGLKESRLLLKTKEERKTGVVNYNPFTDMGRWGCRHNWNWISDEEAIRLRPELKGKI